MESQKRKNEDVTILSENKKANQEIDFSRTQISAESTLLNSHSISQTVSSIVEELEDKMDSAETDINSTEAENIVTVIEESDGVDKSTKDLIALLRKEIADKNQELAKVRSDNRELNNRIQILGSEKLTLESVVTDCGCKIKRYELAIIELNKLVKVYRKQDQRSIAGPRAKK